MRAHRTCRPSCSRCALPHAHGACLLQAKAQKEYAEQRGALQKAADEQERAVRCIQSVWQRYRNKRIYQFYRDLVQFRCAARRAARPGSTHGAPSGFHMPPQARRCSLAGLASFWWPPWACAPTRNGPSTRTGRRERGDPREMLRAINPREAQLADAASGIHVRFRLGGTMFPPLVFYKIFTHRCVLSYTVLQDLHAHACAARACASGCAWARLLCSGERGSHTGAAAGAAGAAYPATPRMCLARVLWRASEP